MGSLEEYLNLDLRTSSGLRPQDLDAFLQGSPLSGLGSAFIQAERRYGVNARYLCAHAVLESGWGTSRIARDKYNLFGFGAYDKNPYKYARSFDSFEQCIDVVAEYIARHYLNPNGKYYNGPTLPAMNKNYATDPNWARKIAQLMTQITEKASSQPGKEVPPSGDEQATEVPPEKQASAQHARRRPQEAETRRRKMFHLFGLKRR